MIDPRVGRPYRIAIWRCRPPAPWWDSLCIYCVIRVSPFSQSFSSHCLYRSILYIRKESFKDIGMFWLQVHVWCYWAEFQVCLLIYISRRIPVKLVLDLASRPARSFCQSQSEAESRKLGAAAPLKHEQLLDAYMLSTCHHLLQKARTILLGRSCRPFLS